MSELKLQKLPDRTPVKLTISISPELNRILLSYADLYQQTYGKEESVVELIPFMLDGFLYGDRTFTRALKKSHKKRNASSGVPVAKVGAK